MNKITARLIPLLIACLTFPKAYSQQNISVVVEQKYVLQNGPTIDSLELNILIPDHYKGRQTVESIKFSKNPDYVYKRDGAKYAHYKLEKSELKRIKSISITTDLIIYDYDLSVARNEKVKLNLKKKERKKYTRLKELYKLPKQEEENIIPAFSANNQFELVEQIQKFVEQHLYYNTSFGRDKGALFALNNGTGDCTEYSDLMIAICRQNGVPARRPSGITVKQKNLSILSEIFKYSSHAWVEVYFEDLGWVPFDPTHSDDSRVTTFENLETKYIYYAFNESTQKSQWRWWGGRGAFNIKVENLARKITDQ